MVFLPGNHALDRNIIVANVAARLTMHGESSSGTIATVVRNGSVGFNFTNMVNFNIYSLAFTSYNRSSSYVSQPASNSALLLQSTQNAKLVNCSFHDNLGTALTVHNTSITLEENKFTHNQCGCESFGYDCKLGCGIAALNSNLTFIGNTTFHENNAILYDGTGAIWASASSLDFNGTNNFIGNSAAWYGGAIHAETNSSLRFNGTSTFSYNSAVWYGGAIHAETNSSLRFNGTSTFSYNSAVRYGGAIHAETNSSLRFNGTSTFSYNSAVWYGGAIHAETNSSLSFNGTSTFSHSSAYEGGAINTDDILRLTFNGTNHFINNSADMYGGAIHAETNSSLSFIGTSDFSHNSADYDGGAIDAYNGVVLTFTGTSSFSNNLAVQGGAITAYINITLLFDGSINFVNNGHDPDEVNMNRDSYGGAINLVFGSTFSITHDTTVYWENNHASFGGAISVRNINFIYCSQIAKFIPLQKCFFQLQSQNLSNASDPNFVFNNNSADAAGTVLFGGTIDNCTVSGLDSHNSGEVFNKLFQYEADNTTSSVSSDPFHVCLCENNNPNCSKSNKTLLVYPGETVQVSAITVGQRNGIAPAQVRSRVGRGTKVLSSQYIQQTNKACTTLNYTVFSQQIVSQLELFADGSCSTFGDKFILELIMISSCPPGFSLENSSVSCICDQALQKYTNNCNITNGIGQITRKFDDMFWVGYDQSHGLIVHPNCPFHYCVNHTVVFSLNNTDMQCAYNRSGLLCGRCKEGYSLVLGTFQCVDNSMQCTNNYLAFLIIFAVMGVALVFLLLVCKLTVATGTLSGLVFYANIVGPHRTIFLPGESTDAFSVFIAWLNLDFGIESCFYEGMDAYSKTWLQFVFPVYIWVLVGLIILISHFSQKFASLLGSNPVSVLATLILLSYAKVLRTFIAAVSFIDLEYHISFTDLDYQDHYNGSVRRMWLFDANVDYLDGKHIPLFIVAVLVFFFLFLPYTVLLLFGQWLQAISHLRLFSWVNNARLKAFLDSYHAPYKAKHRYWPGLLLVLRFVLLLVFALDPQQDSNINLLAILLGAGVLQLWAWVSGGVYKNWCLDALEGSFTLNLIMLVGTTYYVNLSEGNQLAVGYTSVSIALVTFIVILGYHIFQRLRHTKLWKKVPKLNFEFKKLNVKLNKKPNTKQAVNNLNTPIDDVTESVNLDQLREPWLEDLLQPTQSVV